MGEVKLVDVRDFRSREELPEVGRNIDFNKEMSVLVGGRLLRGHEAFVFLSMLSSGFVRGLGRSMSVLPKPYQHVVYISLVRLQLLLLAILRRRPVTI